MIPTAALLALLLVQPPSGSKVPGTAAGRTPASRADSLAVLDRVRRTERRFFLRWRDAWKESEEERYPAGYLAMQEARQAAEFRMEPPPTAPGHPVTPLYTPPVLDSYLPRRRVQAYHCRYEDGLQVQPVPLTSMIRSAVSARSWCPVWQPTATRRPDEAVALDSALAARHRAPIAAARRALLVFLDSMARRLPGDELIAGQRVRFLVDAGAMDAALQAARTCGARPAWCAMLAGYVLARQGAVRSADSTFAAARALMDDRERCGWDDTNALLDSTAAAAYLAMSCAERAAVNERLWWVARPFLSEPWNERRVEQYARKVRIRLHAALDQDERHDWRVTHGGDALVLMLERYGWPSYAFWAGAVEDRAQDEWLRRHQAPASPPYLAPEYDAARVHLVPEWRAVLDPTAARGSDWTLSAPTARHSATWWPVEHARLRGGPIASLPLGQQALFRRATGAQLAVATELDADALGRAPGAGVQAMLVLTSAADPEASWQIGHATAAVGGRLVLDGWLGTAPGLLEVEAAADGAGGVRARARFGITPPPPLAALRPGEVALSDPLLLLPPEAGGTVPDEPDAAIARMLGTNRLRGVWRFGVYWESYGFAPGDTVDVELRLERYDGRGLVDRLATALDVTDERNGVIAVRWREPESGRPGRVLPGAQPVVTRSVALDVGRMPAGRYRLDVSVARPGQPAARSRRELVIE